MVTIGMDRVHFKLPIFLKHLVSIRARICRVRCVVVHCSWFIRLTAEAFMKR